MWQGQGMIPLIRIPVLTLALICAVPAIAQNTPGGEASGQDAPPVADQPATPDAAPEAPSARNPARWKKSTSRT